MRQERAGDPHRRCHIHLEALIPQLIGLPRNQSAAHLAGVMNHKIWNGTGKQQLKSGIHLVAPH
jgi:hypothetical protein